MAAVAAAVVFSVVLLVLLGILLAQRARKGADQTGPKRIVVLPFLNPEATDDDYFVDGVSDAVRGKLASLPGLEVIARASSMAYKKTRETPAQIARGLAVPYLLKGAVRRQGGAGMAGRVRMEVELVQVTSSSGQSSKWKETFDAEATDIFRVQSDIAKGVGLRGQP